MDRTDNEADVNHKWQHGVRALGVLALGIVALIAVVAMLLHDFGVKSFLDSFFGSWSDIALTLLSGTLVLLALAALRALDRSHLHHDVKADSGHGRGRD